MRLWTTTLALALATTAAAAAPLPIAPGDYVITGTPCTDPPFAAMLTYDGQGFSGPHASHCTTRRLARRGASYTIATTCTAAGDGTPTQPATITEQLTILSPRHLALRNTRPGSERLEYRWCTAPAPH